MVAQIARWVVGAVSFVAGVLAIVSGARGPLRVIGEVEVHPTGWILAAAAFAGVLGAMTLPRLYEQLWRAPRRARIERFRELPPTIAAVREAMDRNRARPPGSAEPRDINLYADLDAKLRHLGVYAFGRERAVDYSFLIDAAERGDLRAAGRRFPRSTPRTAGPSSAAVAATDEGCVALVLWVETAHPSRVDAHRYLLSPGGADVLARQLAHEARVAEARGSQPGSPH